LAKFGLKLADMKVDYNESDDTITLGIAGVTGKLTKKTSFIAKLKKLLKKRNQRIVVTLIQ